MSANPKLVPFRATVVWANGDETEYDQLHVWYVCRRNGAVSLCHTSAKNRIDIQNNPNFISWYDPRTGLSVDEEVARFKKMYHVG